MCDGLLGGVGGHLGIQLKGKRLGVLDLAIGSIFRLLWITLYFQQTLTLTATQSRDHLLLLIENVFKLHVMNRPVSAVFLRLLQHLLLEKGKN